jgi:hypothetical protein
MIPLEWNLTSEVIILPGIILWRSQAQVDGAFNIRKLFQNTRRRDQPLAFPLAPQFFSARDRGYHCESSPCGILIKDAMDNQASLLARGKFRASRRLGSL